MIQQHPAYHEGFYDAQFGEALFDDCPSPEYRAGWSAFWECKAILAAAMPPADRPAPENTGDGQ